jgi:hypothetical protein
MLKTTTKNIVALIYSILLKWYICNAKKTNFNSLSDRLYI